MYERSQISLSLADSLECCFSDLGGILDSRLVAETLASEARTSGSVSFSWWVMASSVMSY